MIELTDIHSPKDIKNLSVSELEVLSDMLRAALEKKLGAHGGHVGPNLGVVEATVALHYVFNAPDDKIVFDVSHQSYVHKMLTGRIKAFLNPEDYDDVTGYTCPAESPYDLFEIGHTSTSVSLASGLALARDFKGGKDNVIAFIGDGSLSGGEAFEGLDFGATLNSNFIVVVNDNQMCIAENHGGIYKELEILRDSNGTSPQNIFKSIGYDYMYVREGNNVEALIKAFSQVKDSSRPVVVHINTMKGMGLPVAEENKEKFHYSAPFDLKTGTLLHPDKAEDYADIFAVHMLTKIHDDRNVAVITAATPGSLGFTPGRRKAAGNRFVDVGIAEEQASGMASGMARAGCRPVFGVMSTFLQRAYDQISQDISINHSPVVIVTFGNGIRGIPDVTHLGLFDIAMLSNIPGLIYLAPTCRQEYLSMIDWALAWKEGPVAVRTPGGKVMESDREFPVDYSDFRYEIVEKGEELAIIAEGSCFYNASKAVDILKDRGYSPTLINPRVLTSLDTECLDNLKHYKAVITVEDGVLDGGFGQKVAAYLGESPVKVKCLGFKKEFIDRYSVKEQLSKAGMTPGQIADIAVSLLID